MMAIHDYGETVAAMSHLKGSIGAGKWKIGRETRDPLVCPAGPERF
jgi:hypothetical protein